MVVNYLDIVDHLNVVLHHGDLHHFGIIYHLGVVHYTGIVLHRSGIVYHKCPAGRVFQYRVGYWTKYQVAGLVRVGVSKNTIGYFRGSSY